MEKFRFIEINYYHHAEFNLPEQVITKHRPSNLYLSEFAQHAQVTLLKHLDHEGTLQQGELEYSFFKSKNSFFHVPVKTHRFIKQCSPDIVLVQGFIFPWQVMALRRILGKKPKILLQHHGEVPFRKKRIFQWLMSSKVNGWLFSSRENAKEWIRAGIINERQPCFAIPPASTRFAKKDKVDSRRKLGMDEEPGFLWVGRLNENKDPFTLLVAFDKFIEMGGQGKLYLIYGEAEMEKAVRQILSSRERLAERVVLVGKVLYEQMETWYNASDYLLSTSRREGGSYAIMEAMACGCVPIVSEIPASMELTGQGKAGLHFPAGDSQKLAEVLKSLSKEKHVGLSQNAMEYFEKEMSPSAISSKMLAICMTLLNK